MTAARGTDPGHDVRRAAALLASPPRARAARSARPHPPARCRPPPSAHVAPGPLACAAAPTTTTPAATPRGCRNPGGSLAGDTSAASLAGAAAPPPAEPRVGANPDGRRHTGGLQSRRGRRSLRRRGAGSIRPRAVDPPARRRLPRGRPRPRTARSPSARCPAPLALARVRLERRHRVRGRGRTRGHPDAVDTYFGVGPLVGVTLLLGNWRTPRWAPARSSGSSGSARRRQRHRQHHASSASARPWRRSSTSGSSARPRCRSGSCRRSFAYQSAGDTRTWSLGVIGPRERFGCAIESLRSVLPVDASQPAADHDLIERREVLDAAGITRTLRRMAFEIAERVGAHEDALYLVGVRNRGRPGPSGLASMLVEAKERKPALGRRHLALPRRRVPRPAEAGDRPHRSARDDRRPHDRAGRRRPLHRPDGAGGDGRAGRLRPPARRQAGGARGSWPARSCPSSRTSRGSTCRPPPRSRCACCWPSGARWTASCCGSGAHDDVRQAPHPRDRAAQRRPSWRRSRSWRALPGDQRPADQEGPDPARQDGHQPLPRGVDAHPDVVEIAAKRLSADAVNICGVGVVDGEGRDAARHRPQPGRHGAGRGGGAPRPGRGGRHARGANQGGGGQRGRRRARAPHRGAARLLDDPRGQGADRGPRSPSAATSGTAGSRARTSGRATSWARVRVAAPRTLLAPGWSCWATTRAAG